MEIQQHKDRYDKLTPTVQNRLDKLLQQDFVSQENAEAVTHFISKLDSSGERDAETVKDYITDFKMMLPLIDFDLMEATCEDIELLHSDLVDRAEDENKSPDTLRERRVTLNKFYKDMFPARRRPDRVYDILESDATNTTHPDDGELKKHYEFIWPDEVLEMSEAAMNRRDALIPLFFYCTGARLEEVRSIQLKDVTRKDTHVTIEVMNQKNKQLPPTRNNHLSRCTSLLREWLENHPRRDDPEAYLFCVLQGGYDPNTGDKVKDAGDQISRKSLGKVLDKLADRIDMEKPHNPHAFRYSMATFYAHKRQLDIHQLAKRGGWGSLEQVRNYILDVEKIDGNDRLPPGVEPENDIDALDKRKCGNCDEVSDATRDICRICGHALTDKVAINRERDESELVVEVAEPNGLHRDQQELEKAL